MEKKGTDRGSLTVEALLFLIPFMLAFLTVVNAGRFVQTEMLMHHAITQTAKQISAYGYVLTKTKVTETMINTNKKSAEFKEETQKTVDYVKKFSDSVSDFAAGGDLQDVIDSRDEAQTQLSEYFSDPDALASGVMSVMKSGMENSVKTYLVGEFAKASIKNSVGKITDDVDTYLENVGIVDGLDGLDFSQSKWMSVTEGKGDVKIVVTYTMKNNLFPQFDFGQYKFRQCVSTLMW